MRTVEEIKEWIAKNVEPRWGVIPDAYARGMFDGRERFVADLLKFINSEPPCQHPNKRFFDLANTIKLAFLTAAGSAGATNSRELMQSECFAIAAKFCPDCGEKLQ